MTILEEAAQIAKDTLSGEFDGLTIERCVIGIFYTGVKLSNASAGICFTPVKEMPKAVCCPSSAGRSFDPVHIKGMAVNKAISALNSTEPVKTAVAIATLNALSASCWERGLKGHYIIRERVDAQDIVRMPDHASVAVVGALVPTLRALKRRGGTWWVIEKDPRTLKNEDIQHYVPAERTYEAVSFSWTPKCHFGIYLHFKRDLIASSNSMLMRVVELVCSFSEINSHGTRLLVS